MSEPTDKIAVSRADLERAADGLKFAIGILSEPAVLAHMESKGPEHIAVARQGIATDTAALERITAALNAS